MSRVLVAGLGCELRGDDEAGLLAVRALRELGVEGVDVEEHRDAMSLAASMARHPAVVIVDAVDAAGAPGEVVELAPDAAQLRGTVSCHGFGLRHAVELVRALGASPAVLVIGITGHDFQLGAPPSPAVTRAAAGVAARLKESLRCA